MDQIVKVSSLRPGDLVEVGGGMTTWERLDSVTSSDAGLRILHLQPVLAGPEMTEPVPCGDPRQTAMRAWVEVRRRGVPSQRAGRRRSA
ncbi:hypothetical protein [Nocardioides alkalitolerans]|uniref:hypothetical protein n=1 Tax=Nocardioides alkalitolerans TaxID=281714 RepID=UPI00042A2242|nr:hypothetical protein [Nocardioides alkalitolerans]